MAVAGTEMQAAAALDAAYRTLTDASLRDAILDEETADAALEQLALPTTDAVRAPLLNLINRFATGPDHPAERPVDARSEPPTRRMDVDRRVQDNVDRIVMASYQQIRVSFWISAVMSIVLFVMGMTFLALAVGQAREGDREGTIAIAGLGIADFVLLFYTHPRRDVAKNLESSQRVHLVATSYLFGIGLAARHDEQALVLLQRHTSASVDLLDSGRPQRAAPERPGGAELDDTTASASAR